MSKIGLAAATVDMSRRRAFATGRGERERQERVSATPLHKRVVLCLATQACWRAERRFSLTHRAFVNDETPDAFRPSPHSALSACHMGKEATRRPSPVRTHHRAKSD